MIRWFRRSLMARLVGHFLLLSLVIVVLAGSLAFRQARKALETSVAERLEVLAILGEEQLLRWVAEQRRDLIYLASLPSLRKLAADLLESDGAQPGGAQPGSAQPGDAEPGAFSESRERLYRFLDSTTDLKPHLQEILLLSPQGGLIVACSDRAHEGEYRVNDSFFLRGLEQTFVQNVYPSPLTFAPTMTISTPLRDDSGRVLGVLAAHLDLEELDRIAQPSTGLGTTGDLYLVDRLNAFVSATRFGRDQFPRGVRSRGIETAIAGEDGQDLYRDHRGRRVIGAYRWIEELELALLVEITQAEALGPARHLAALIFGVGLLLALALTVGTLLLARQIARPVLAVTESALRVSQGDLSATAPVSTEDEIGVLARTFNEMTEKLSELYRDLRQENSIRRQAQEELESKNAELERFTYTVSHDLKSPLVTITGFLGFLEKDVARGEPARVERDIERIRSAALTMSRLLDELLELSRIGRVTHPPEDVAMDELAREAVELLSGPIEQRGVEVSIADPMPTVRGDRIRLLEIFQNLVENGIKFMGTQPAPRIEIGHEDRDEHTVFYVRDNGQGIPPKHHEKVFGLFERLQPDETEGTGVGLALVKRIVEVHGGRIWVESKGLGHGSTFVFTVGDGPDTDSGEPMLRGVPRPLF